MSVEVPRSPGVRRLNGNEFDLVAYWQLNGSLSDATENANTLENNATAIFFAVTSPASIGPAREAWRFGNLPWSCRL